MSHVFRPPHRYPARGRHRLWAGTLRAPTTYFIDFTTGDDADSGLTEALAWKTLANIDDTHLANGDVVLLKRGETWRELLQLNSGAGFTRFGVRIGAYGTGADPIIKGSDDISTASFQWTASASGTNEWYVEAAGGGNPGLTQGNQAFLDGVRMAKGTLGSLTDHQWAWGDNDTLGFSTVYFRDDSGDPDTTGVLVELGSASRARCMIGGTTRTILEDIRFTQGDNEGLFFQGGGDFITLRRCEIDNSWIAGVKYFDASLRSSYGLIDNCNIHDVGASGVQLSDNSFNWTVQNCEVSEFARLDEGSADFDFTAGIKIANSTHHVIQSNHVHDGGNNTASDPGAGIWCDINGNFCIFRYNIVTDCFYQGLKVEISNDCEVYYNVVARVTGHTFAGGINIGRGTTGRNQRNKCYNNTVHACTNGIIVEGNFPAEADNCNDNEVVNNIVTGTTQRAIWAFRGGENDGTNGSGNIYEHNVVEEATDFVVWGGVDTPNYDTISAWETAESEAINNVDGDATTEYTDAATDDFTLKTGAAAIGAARDVGLTQDLVGTAVPQDGSFDSGAYEFVPSTTIAVPAGSLAITGQVPTPDVSATLRAVPAGNLTITGQAPALDLAVPVGAAVLAIATFAASLTLAVPVGAASLSITGQTPTPDVSATLRQVPAGSLSITGQAPTASITANVVVSVPAGSLTVAGAAPSLLVTVPVGAGTLAIVGLAPVPSVAPAVPAAFVSVDASVAVAAHTRVVRVAAHLRTITVAGHARVIRI